MKWPLSFIPKRTDYSLSRALIMPSVTARSAAQNTSITKSSSCETFRRNSGRGKADATIVVYPHYFSGARTAVCLHRGRRHEAALRPALDVVLHAAHRPRLSRVSIARAKGSWWWNESAIAFRHCGHSRRKRQRARDAHCTGFIPSLECYSYVQTHEEFGEPWLNGRRQAPLGFGWLAEGDSPYRELPMRGGARRS